MQEKFEEQVFNNNSIYNLCLLLDNDELDKLCDYLLNFLKKEKFSFHIIDIMSKIVAVYCEISIMKNISHNIDNRNYFLYSFLGICIIALNEVYNSIQNELKFRKAIIKQINDKNLIKQ